MAAFAALFALASCEPEQVIDSTKLELSQKTLAFESGAQSQTITITAGRSWKVEFAEGVDWVSVTPGSGQASADPQNVTITVVPNKGYDRTTYVTVTIGIIKEHSRRRTQIMPVDYAQYNPGLAPYPVEVTVGGATIFVLDVDHMEKI